jgi:putative intracellular protease/amidase
MKNRKCFMFVFAGFADWEPAMTTSALNRFTDFEVITFSIDGKPVRSFGNLSVIPDTTMNAVNVSQLDLLLLPGGETWDENGNREIIPLLNKVLDANKTVAAICGATGFLANHGYLDATPHTSNHLTYYLKQVAPDYKGEALYIDRPAVASGNLITASGTAPVEFASEILEHFDLFKLDELKTWFGYFRRPEVQFQSK